MSLVRGSPYFLATDLLAVSPFFLYFKLYCLHVFMRHLTLNSLKKYFPADSIFFGKLEAPTKHFELPVTKNQADF